MTDLLLRGGCVLSLSSKVGNHPSADVLIEQGRISEIGQKLRAPRGAETIDATDTIVMPGFVDGHRHLWKSLFCGLGSQDGAPDLSSVEFLYGPNHSSEDIYAATLVGLLRGLEAGTTTVVDWYHAPGDHLDAALQAHADAGTRAVFVLGASGKEAEPGQWRSRIRSLAERGVGSSLMTMAAGVPDPATGDRESIASSWTAARDLGLRIHARVGRDPGGSGMVASLADMGVLGPDVTLVHCTPLDDSDLDAIAQSGAKVVLTPSTEMSEAMGSPPLQRMIDRRIHPGLGVEGGALAPGDMFAQMRAVISLQHAAYFDLKLAGKGGLPRLLTTREVIRWATSAGAGAVGLGSTTGALEPGLQADVIVLRADRPNIAPVNDPIGAVVWGMDTSNVDWVIVGGQVMMREGVLEGDIQRARSLAVASRDRVGAESGLVSSMGDSP